MVSLTIEGPPPPDPDAKQTPGKFNAFLFNDSMVIFHTPG